MFAVFSGRAAKDLRIGDALGAEGAPSQLCLQTLDGPLGEHSPSFLVFGLVISRAC